MSRASAPGRGPDDGAARRRSPALLAASAIVATFGGLLWLVAVLTDVADGPGTATQSPAGPGGAPDAPVAGPPSPTARSTLASPAAAPEAGARSPESHLARARRLLDANRGEAQGATPEGLGEAEAEVRAAMRLGAAGLPQAWRLLADVLAARRDRASTDAERTALRQQEREALERVLDATPGDAEARFRHALLTEDRRARTSALARAVRDGPRDFRPRLALGEELLQSGRADEGARVLVEAAELCDREQLGVHGPDVVHLLRLHGREEEASRVRERMERLGY